MIKSSRQLIPVTEGVLTVGFEPTPTRPYQLLHISSKQKK